MRKFVFAFLVVALFCSLSFASSIKASGYFVPETHSVSLLTTYNAGIADITAYSVANCTITVAGTYLIIANSVVSFTKASVAEVQNHLYIKTGSATYGSAVEKLHIESVAPIVATTYPQVDLNNSGSVIVTLNAGDLVHLGIGTVSTGGVNTIIFGNTDELNATSMRVIRIY